MFQKCCYPNWIFSWVVVWKCSLALRRRRSQPGNLKFIAAMFEDLGELDWLI